ncbi:fused DSP-PTPase phosphatase/NAD kinase-like protein [Aquisphaera insulae]|uniref:fused DSP-PTPase phosphatase/NAD kinase-like protein n=1 Tax=Aquisphaera insulae TaxID=2712864 RepID=UPI00202E0E17|nr:tyrosine-protein phosphatase [Aquisphaera insulae]
MAGSLRGVRAGRDVLGCRSVSGLARIPVAGLVAMRKVVLGLLVLAGVGVTGWMIHLDRQGRLVWDHWDTVKPGILYRSGQLTGDQLAAAVERYGIRTVVNFQLPGREMKAERELAGKLGVGFVNLPMPGDGFGEEAQFRKVLEVVDDPARRPVLVHCARGTCRTGSAVAMYRYERDGWTIEDVAAELKRQAYRDGHIAGYIYAMAHNKPSLALHNPQTIDDRNGTPVEVEPQSDVEPLPDVVPPREDANDR